MVTQQERERAAELARRQVQQEAQELADGSAPVLRAMSVAILAVGKHGHPELRDDLTALKGLWRKVVFEYLQSLKRTAQADELSELNAIVDAMRRGSCAEPIELGKPSIGRMRRVMARAVRPAAEVLDAG
jgi:hypothetical protein